MEPCCTHIVQFFPSFPYRVVVMNVHVFGRVSVMQTLWMKSLCWGRGAALCHSGGVMPDTSVPSRSSLPSSLLPLQVHLLYTRFLECGSWIINHILKG